MAHIKEIELEKQREKFKKNYGVDIMTREGRLLLKNELYKRDKVKFINDLVCIEDRDSPGIPLS